MEGFGFGIGAGGVECEGESPESIGVAVFAAIGAEADIAGGGVFFFDGTEIGTDFGSGRDADEFFLHGDTEWVGEGFFDGIGEGDTFGATEVFVVGAFGELATDAGLVDADAADIWHFEEVVEEFFLDREGSLFEDLDEAGVEDVAGFFEEPEDGEIVVAAEIDAEVEIVGREFDLREVVVPVGIGGVFDLIDEFVGDEGGGVIGGSAHVFLEEGFVVGAGVFDRVEVFGAVHVETGVGLGEFGFEFFEETLVEGIFEGDAVEGDVSFVFAVSGLLDEAVEEVVGAAVGGDDGDLAAPGDAGVGDGEEFLGVLVEGEFVEDTGASFSCLCVGAGGEGVDTATVSKFEVGVVRFEWIGEDWAVEVGFGEGVEFAGEIVTIAEEEAGLEFIA